MTISQFGLLISRFLHRFHVILFVIFVIGGLSLVTLFLSFAITKQDTSITGTTDAPFNKATMSKIENLRTTSDQSNLSPPSGRINPFVR